MDTSSTLEPTADEVVEIRASIRRYLAQMDQIHQQMEETQIEIDRLKQETQAIAREPQVILDRLKAA